MKVILLQEVPGLGKPGDVKDVADGYARNYLLPRQLVTPATVAALTQLRERVAAAQRKVERQRQEHEALAARIAGITLTFEVRVGRGDRLYGSVTSQDIANALVELENLRLDRRIIQLREPLRQLGTFEVGLRIAPGVEPRLKVVIIPSRAGQTSETSSHAAEAESAQAEPVEAAEASAE